MGKNKRKNSNSNGGTNGSPRGNSNNNTNGGNNGGSKGNRDNNNRGNGGSGGNNKGKVPQEFSECRICQRKGHWESDCRNNPAGEGKRTKDSPNCRECNGNHWEDQCRSWKSKNNGGGNGNNNNNNNGNGNGQQANSNPGQCLAPNGEDISHFFADGKFPNRPCKKCKVSGHWNNACEKEGFNAVTNPNPGGKRNENGKGKEVSFPDGQTNGQIGAAYNQYQPPPGTQQQQQIPLVNFGVSPQEQPQAQYNSAAPLYQPTDPRYFNNRESINTHTPDYVYRDASPPYMVCPAEPNPDHPSHPDSSIYLAQYRSHTCATCQTPGHKTADCLTYPYLLPRTNVNWRPHPDLHHPSNSIYPRPSGYWKGDPTRIPSKNTYIWPHPQNSHQGRYWSENDYELQGSKDVWIDQDDREGESRSRWGMPPGGVGYGGEEHGGMCRFDWEGDVFMEDILDLEWRRWASRRRREEERERRKPWWQGGEMEFDERL